MKPYKGLHARFSSRAAASVCSGVEDMGEDCTPGMSKKSAIQEGKSETVTTRSPGGEADLASKAFLPPCLWHCDFSSIPNASLSRLTHIKPRYGGLLLPHGFMRRDKCFGKTHTGGPFGLNHVCPLRQPTTFSTALLPRSSQL